MWSSIELYIENISYIAAEPLKSRTFGDGVGELPLGVPDDLFRAARSVLNNAYAPYSGYKVASAVRAESGNIYTGTNVENASYGLSMCAERVAVFNAVSRGERKIKEVLVLFESGEPAPPCGACLQVISEFGDDDTVIHSVSLSGGERTWRLSELLPTRFNKEYLSRKKGPEPA